MLSRGLRPAVVLPYGVALVIAVVAIVFFGWAGFWLGVAAFVLAKLGRWGVPLIRLSYARERDESRSFDR